MGSGNFWAISRGIVDANLATNWVMAFSLVNFHTAGALQLFWAASHEVAVTGQASSAIMRCRTIRSATLRMSQSFRLSEADDECYPHLLPLNPVSFTEVCI